VRLDEADARDVVAAAHEVAHLDHVDVVRPVVAADIEFGEARLELREVAADVADHRHASHGADDTAGL
jgi:hypothetical protein